MKILLLIDVQEIFVNYEYKSHSEAIKRIGALTGSGFFDDIHATKFFNTEDSPFNKIMGWDLGSDTEALLTPDFVNKASVVKMKSTYSLPEDYIEELKELQAEAISVGEELEIYLTGFDTDACVLSTAMQLFDLGIKPVVVSDACHSKESEYHEMGMKLIRRNLGSNCITTASDILAQSRVVSISIIPPDYNTHIVKWIPVENEADPKTS